LACARGEKNRGVLKVASGKTQRGAIFFFCAIDLSENRLKLLVFYFYFMPGFSVSPNTMV
jgi:hypothetical protein